MTTCMDEGLGPDAAWENLRHPTMRRGLLKLVMIQRRMGLTHRHLHRLMEAAVADVTDADALFEAIAELPGDVWDPDDTPGGEARAAAFRSAWHEAEEAVEAPARKVEQLGMILVPSVSSWYPPLLRHFPLSPPAVLFVRGTGYRRALQRPFQLTVVGSRKMTSYGRRFIEYHLPTVVERPTTIISGLAYGVDAWAHQTAIRSGGDTLAVMPCGLDRCYPSDHEPLAKEILRAGALISEYLPGTPVRRRHFAARNRILAGLGQATVVVEADRRSGALITANQAQDGGRDTLALPGSVFAPMSRGTLDLLYGGAGLLRHGGDIISAVTHPAPRPFPEAATATGICRTAPGENGGEEDECEINMPPVERKILEVLRQETLTADRLAKRLSEPLIPVLLALSRLELKGLIDQEQGLYALTSYGHSSI